MKLGNKKEKNIEETKNENDIEIVFGDDSNSNISDVGDFMNDLRPKNHNTKKNLVIPKSKKEKN